MSNQERSNYLVAKVEETFGQRVWAVEIKNADIPNKKPVVSLETLLRWVDGVAQMVSYYDTAKVDPPEGYGRGPLAVSKTHMGLMLGPDRDWVGKCEDAAKLLAMPGVRRRRPQIDEAYCNLFAARVAAETPPDDDDYEAVVVMMASVKGREPEERSLWAVGSLITQLRMAAGEEDRAISRRSL